MLVQVKGLIACVSATNKLSINPLKECHAIYYVTAMQTAN